LIAAAKERKRLRTLNDDSPSNTSVTTNKGTTVTGVVPAKRTTPPLPPSSLSSSSTKRVTSVRAVIVDPRIASRQAGASSTSQQQSLISLAPTVSATKKVKHGPARPTSTDKVKTSSNGDHGQQRKIRHDQRKTQRIKRRSTPAFATKGDATDTTLTDDATTSTLPTSSSTSSSSSRSYTPTLLSGSHDQRALDRAFYEEILCWDLWEKTVPVVAAATPSPSNNVAVSTVPSSPSSSSTDSGSGKTQFHDADEYRRYFMPLLLEDYRASLMNTLDGRRDDRHSKLGPCTIKSLNPVARSDILFLLELKYDGRMERLEGGEIVLLTDSPLTSSSNTAVAPKMCALAVLDRVIRFSSSSQTLVFRVAITRTSSERVRSMQTRLSMALAADDSTNPLPHGDARTIYMLRLDTATTTRREYAALQQVDKLALLKQLLHPIKVR
jgi:hypothetical protein